MQTEPFEVDLSVAYPILQIELQHLDFLEETETLAETCFCFLNHSNSSRMPCTLSNGTQTMFLCVRNSIPMNTKF